VAEANLRWKADTAEAIAKTEALKRVVASVGGSSTTSAIKNLGASWKVLVPAIAAAGVAVLGLTGNLAVLAPLIPALTIGLTGMLAPFTALAALVVGFIPPLTLLLGLFGALGAAAVIGFKGAEALKALNPPTQALLKAFSGLEKVLGKLVLPYLIQLEGAARTAIGYFTKLAGMNLGDAFKSLSTTGVHMLQKFLDAVGNVIRKPIRLAFKVAFGKSDTLRNALVDDWNDIVNFFVGHKGVALPVRKWFGKQDFTAVGYRWAAELAGAFMTGLGLALKKMWASQGGKFILGGLSVGTIAGLAATGGSPIGAAMGAAIGVAIGIALNHYWPRITADASKAFHKVGALLKQALGAKEWNQIISLAQSFWDTMRSIGSVIQKTIYPVVRRVFNALGGWHTVGAAIVLVVRSIVGAFVLVGEAIRVGYNLTLNLWRAVARAASTAKGQLAPAFNAVRAAVGAVLGAINSIVSAIRAAVGLAQQLANALSSGLGGSPGSPGGSRGPSTGKGHAAGATGAIVTRPTYALIGEKTAEAVIPLNRMPGASPLGALGGPQIVQNFYGLDDATLKQAAAKLVPIMNRSMARRA
jgi:hypothetical protein